MDWHPDLPPIALPCGWPVVIKSALIHAISLAHITIVRARGWAANSINARVRLAAENERLKQEAELLREEIRIKDVRVERIPAQRRLRCSRLGLTVSSEVALVV